MNKVDLYVNGFRLDLFDDEEITIILICLGMTTCTTLTSAHTTSTTRMTRYLTA
jgi:hypothetical protein